MWSAIPVALLCMIVVEGGSRAAAPKGSMTYAFTQGNFLLLLLLLLLLRHADASVTSKPASTSAFESAECVDADGVVVDARTVTLRRRGSDCVVFAGVAGLSGICRRS